MAWFDFVWYDKNIQHLSDHGVTPEEFEEVVMAARKFDISRTGASMVQGRTKAGRFLCCIFRKLDPITVFPETAYEPTKGNE